ncbi:MAG: hypothetical protein E7660_03885 [Ruminococcaceae bacterium]|nr:hypothetical protein [Oscillospiraceae bacterium]
MENITEKRNEAEFEKAAKTGGGRKKKTVLIVWISVVLVICAASLLLLKNPELFDKEAGNIKVTGSNGFYDWFYEADFSLALEDHESYPEYLELDRYLYYKNGSETVGVIDKNRDSFGDEVLFFEKYFKTVIDGDHEAYNEMFTEAYLNTYGEKEAFTPQMVYGMQIEEVYENETDGVLTYGFDVDYKIFQNNGTFRDDIYSDASRTLYIEINDASGEFKIDVLKYYVYAADE